MSVIGTNSETLLTGLSSFWQTLFEDKDQLNALYAGTEVLLGQAYLDMLTEVLNANLDEMPLFNKEYWHLLVVREDLVEYVDGDEAPYHFTPEDPLVDAEFLFNRIYDPSFSWERGVDFEVEDRTVKFYADPFGQNLPGVASRVVTIEPTEYRQGTDGSFDTGSPKTFVVDGLVREDSDGEVFGNTKFRSLKAGFTRQDLNRRVTVEDPNNPGPANAYQRTIEGILDEATVTLDSPIPDTASDLRWQILDDKVFFDADIGDTIEIQDPADVSNTLSYVIDSINANNREVVFTEDIDFSTNQAGLKWVHQSPEEVEELSFWIPDAFFDRENLYLSFGYLINRYEPSTEAYRALIQGIFQFFMLGPALRRVEAALNVMVGIPVTKSDGEVIESLYTTNTNYVVETDRETYYLPLETGRDDLDIGTELEAFEPLSKVFTVTDYREDPDWFYGLQIPKTLIDNDSVKDRNADPNPYDFTLGGSKTGYVGDPRSYIGADYSGELTSDLSGSDMVIDDPSLQRVYLRERKVRQETEGAVLKLAGESYEITNTSLLNEEYVELYIDAEESELTELKNAFELTGGTIPYDGHAIFSFSNADFHTNRAPGKLLLVTETSGSAHDGVWKITQVVDSQTVRVEPSEVSGTPTYADSTTLEATLTYTWKIDTRPPIKHNVGYALMRDYLRYHMFFVSYDFNKYNVPYLRAQEDIRDVILKGKPAHVYAFFAPENQVEDEVFLQSSIDNIGLKMDASFSQESFGLQIGGDWRIGDYYGHVSNKTLWVDTVRNNELGTEVELLKADEADEVVLTANFEGGTSPYISVDIYTWNGNDFVPNGESVDLGPGAAQNVAVFSTNGLRTAVVTTVSGSPGYADLQYGYRKEDPGLILLAKENQTSTTGELVEGVKFYDANYSFHAIDVGRHIVVEVNDAPVRAVIRSVLDEHTVLLKPEETIPVDTGYTWWRGAPQRFMTPLAIGSDSVDIAADSLADWPVEVSVILSPYAPVIATSPDILAPFEFSSTSADGQILYEDSGLTTSVDAAGEPIGGVRWPDNAVDINQTDDANRVIWNGEGLGAEFDDTNAIDAHNPSNVERKAGTFAFVTNTKGAAITNWVFHQSLNAGTSGGIRVRNIGTAGRTQILLRDDVNGTGLTFIDANGGAVDTRRLQVFTYDYDDNEFRGSFRLDGVEVASNVWTGWQATSKMTDRYLTLGGIIPNDAGYTGTFFEVAVWWKKFTTQELADIEATLMARWNI